MSPMYVIEYIIGQPNLEAVAFLDKHQSVLSQSLSDPVAVDRALHGEGVITGEVLSVVESATFSLPKERVKMLLAAVREAVRTNHRSLETFATVLCKFGGNVQLGEAIHSDYGESKYLYMMS